MKCQSIYNFKVIFDNSDKTNRFVFFFFLFSFFRDHLLFTPTWRKVQQGSSQKNLTVYATPPWTTHVIFNVLQLRFIMIPELHKVLSVLCTYNFIFNDTYILLCLVVFQVFDLGHYQTYIWQVRLIDETLI
jgi:hypothetical protein